MQGTRNEPPGVCSWAGAFIRSAAVSPQPLRPLRIHLYVDVRRHTSSPPPLFCPSSFAHRPARFVVECPLFITPSNAVSLMRDRNIPHDVDVFKLDIDRCEGHLLDLVLQVTDPQTPSGWQKN